MNTENEQTMKIPKKAFDELSENVPNNNIQKQMLATKTSGKRTYGPRKLQLIHTFLGKLQMLEKRGVNTKEVTKYVMGKKTRRVNGKNVTSKKHNTFQTLTTKQISGLISQLNGL